MPQGRRSLQKALGDMLGLKQDKPKLYPALLGAYVAGAQSIQVVGRPDYVWCRMRGATSEVIQAFNDTVGRHWDLPILVYRDPNAPNIWRVYGRDIRQYNDWEGASYLMPHGDSHSFAGGKTGSDIAWIFKRQYMPLLPHPLNSGTMGVYIEPDFWYYQGAVNWWPGSGTPDLTSSRPTGAVNGCFVTVYMDGVQKIPKLIKGAEFNAWAPPPDPGGYISLPTPTQGVPICAVFLTTGTTLIAWGDIYDLRTPNQPLGSVTASGSFVLRDEGRLLGPVDTLDFRGPGVSAAISGSYGIISVPGPGVDQIGMMGQDEGVPLGTGTTLNVVGAGASLSRSGTVLELNVPGGGVNPPVTGTVEIEDEGTPLGSVKGFNFTGAGVTATVSGSYCEVNVPGGGGGGGGAGIMGWDEGVPLGTGTILNAVGAGVVLSLSGNVLELSVLGTVAVQGHGVPLGNAVGLNFTGAGVTATVSGSYCEVNIPGGGGGGGGLGIFGWDEGAPLGTGTILNVVGGGAQLSLSGSVLQLSVPTPSISVGAGATILGPADTLLTIGQQHGQFRLTGTTAYLENSWIADRHTSSGTPFDDEFEGSQTLAPKWTVTGGTAGLAFDQDLTWPSHLYWLSSGTQSFFMEEIFGLANNGSGSFSVVAAFEHMPNSSNNFAQIGVKDPNDQNRYNLVYGTDGSGNLTCRVDRRIAGVDAFGVIALVPPRVSRIYLCIQRDGTQTWSFFWSTDGLTWVPLGVQQTQAFTTLSRLTVGTSKGTGNFVNRQRYGIDWIRINHISMTL